MDPTSKVESHRTPTAPTGESDRTPTAPTGESKFFYFRLDNGGFWPGKAWPDQYAFDLVCIFLLTVAYEYITRMPQPPDARGPLGRLRLHIFNWVRAIVVDLVFMYCSFNAGVFASISLGHVIRGAIFGRRLQIRPD